MSKHKFPYKWYLKDGYPAKDTITANQCEGFFHSTEKRKISDNECKLIGTYPYDYNFKELRTMYLIGMSVPPVMTAQVAHQIYLQWFKNLHNA